MTLAKVARRITDAGVPVKAAPPAGLATQASRD
jgi:hypothetical protein